MLYCVELKTRPETEALFYHFKDLFFIYMSTGGSGVKILETHVEPRTTAKLT